MRSRMLKINLSKTEYIYLCQAAFIHKRLRETLFSAQQTKDIYLVNISEEQAEEIRELCGEELQIAGFDEKYELTPEGEILESLIDKFFIG